MQQEREEAALAVIQKYVQGFLARRRVEDLRKEAKYLCGALKHPGEDGEA